MRVRKYKRIADVVSERQATNPKPVAEVPVQLPAVVKQKPATGKGFNPRALLRKIVDNPDFSVQLMVIIFSLASENFAMDRRIDSMSSTVDKIRNVTDVINNTMKSVKVATEAPKQIRRLFEQ